MGSYNIPLLHKWDINFYVKSNGWNYLLILENKVVNFHEVNFQCSEGSEGAVFLFLVQIRDTVGLEIFSEPHQAIAKQYIAIFEARKDIEKDFVGDDGQLFLSTVRPELDQSGIISGFKGEDYPVIASNNATGLIFQICPDSFILTGVVSELFSEMWPSTMKGGHKIKQIISVDDCITYSTSISMTPDEVFLRLMIGLSPLFRHIADDDADYNWDLWIQKTLATIRTEEEVLQNNLNVSEKPLSDYAYVSTNIGKSKLQLLLYEYFEAALATQVSPEQLILYGGHEWIQIFNHKPYVTDFLESFESLYETAVGTAPLYAEILMQFAMEHSYFFLQGKHRSKNSEFIKELESKVRFD